MHLLIWKPAASLKSAIFCGIVVVLQLQVSLMCPHPKSTNYEVSSHEIFSVPLSIKHMHCTNDSCYMCSHYTHFRISVVLFQCIKKHPCSINTNAQWVGHAISQTCPTTLTQVMSLPTPSPLGSVSVQSSCHHLCLWVLNNISVSKSLLHLLKIWLER
jgi:hypothetical protein